MIYSANPARYADMTYRRAGTSGLKLPVLSLGLWQNFGGNRDYADGFAILAKAFDSGITHFDLANNYGPPPGSAEEFFGNVLTRDFRPYRDELIVSSKAGYLMWDGPYGEWGSRKNLIASCDQSLSRLKLDYVDVFYSHRYDPVTPLEETLRALADLVRAGKALYVGISNYPAEETRRAHEILQGLGVPCTLNQPSYSMLNRWVDEDGTREAVRELGMGLIAFSPLSQGVLTGKYNGAYAPDARGNSNNPFLKTDNIPPSALKAAANLAGIARERGQSMPQLALSWLLSQRGVTSALIGVRTPEQLDDNLGVLDNLDWSEDELAMVDTIVGDGPMCARPSWPDVA